MLKDEVDNEEMFRGNFLVRYGMIYLYTVIILPFRMDIGAS